jgi:hypothetical protein
MPSEQEKCFSTRELDTCQTKGCCSRVQYFKISDLSKALRISRRSKIAGRPEPTFERFFYTPAVERGLTELCELALLRDGVAFCAMEARPGDEGCSVAWAMLDAAGARMVGRTTLQLPIKYQGGGGAWILHWTKHGSPPRLEWRYRTWSAAELLSHSTYLETTNAIEVADVLLGTGVQDLVMVMDNASWNQDARILSCGAESMIAPLQAFARRLIKYPDARIFMILNNRTKGKEADAISKALLRLPEFGGLLGWHRSKLQFHFQGHDWKIGRG